MMANSTENMDEPVNQENSEVINDFNYDDLYQIKFKKIKKHLEKNKIELPKEIEDKNQLISFLKEKEISKEKLLKILEKDLHFKINKKVVLPIASFFSSFKKEKKDEKNSTQQSGETNKQFLDEENGEKKRKRKWKFPSSLLIITGILFLFIILTWIPHEPYNPDTQGTGLIWNAIVGRDGTDIATTGRFGLLDSIYAVLAGFYEAIPLFLYLFALGAIIQILVDTGSFERGIGSTLKGLENKKILAVPILFTMFSGFGTIWGMQEEAIPYYTILIPFMILSGFTPITSLMILMLANTTGMMASVTNPFSPGVAIDSLGPNWDGYISMGTGIVTRFIIWIILTGAGATFVTWHALKHSKKEDPDHYNNMKDAYITKFSDEMIRDEYEFETMKRKDKISLSFFGITMFCVVLGVFPWQTWWPNFGTGFGFGSSYISNFFAAPGMWGFIDLTALIVVGIVIQIIIHGPRKYEWTTILMDGARGMLGVSIIIGIARGASVVLTYSGLSLVMVNGLSHLPGQDTNYGFLMFIFISSISIGTIIPSTSGAAGILFPIVGQLKDPIDVLGHSNVTLMSSSVIVFAMCLGLTNMFTPAQAVLLASVEKSGVTYGQYMKSAWGFILMQLLIMLIFIIPILSILD